MENNFQSNGKGRSQRVWQLLISMLFILTMGIGQMWADQTYYMQTPGASTAAFTGDFYTTATLGQNVTCSYDDVNYKKAIKFGSVSTSWGNHTYTDRVVRYDCRTNKTVFTVVTYSTNATKKVYMGHATEGAIGSDGTCSSSFTQETTNANAIKTHTYTVEANNPSSFYVSVDNNAVYIVQIIAVEQGAVTFPRPGTDGYSLNFKKGRFNARSGSATIVDKTASADGIEIIQNQNYQPGSTSTAKMQTNNTHYIKFSVAEKIVLSFVTASNKNYTVGAKGSTAGPITPTANKAQLIKISAAGTYYINPQGSNITPTSMSFYIPVITYNKNNADAEGTMSTNTWTVADNGFTAPEGKEFKEWNNKADGTGDAIAVGAEMLTDTTLYAIWQTPAAPASTEPTITDHPSTSAAQYIKDATAAALTVTATGSGDVTYQWYSNTTASNADGTIIDGATSASYTPSTAAVGTLYYYCAVTNTESGKSATTVKSDVSGAITVIAAPTHLVENRLNVTSGDWSSNIYTNDPTNITSLTAWQIAAGQDRTAGVTDKQSIKNNRTHGIGTTATKTDGYYMYLSFTIADGKRLKLSAVNIPVFGISNSKTTEVEIADANSTKITVNGTITADTDGNGFGTYNFSEAPYLQGAVTLKMWAYDYANGYRMKSPIYLDGAISDIPVCTPPDPPTGLQVDSKTYNSVNLSWDGSGTNAYGYRITLTSATGAGTFEKDEASNTCEATGLTPNTAYTFKVKGYAAGKLCSSDEVTVNFTTEAAPAQFTVHYMDEDGTTPLGSDELVVVGEHPVGLSPAPTKPLYTFAAWQLSGSDIALNAVSAAANEEVTLTARWEKLYASTIDIEEFIDDNGTSGDWATYLSNHGYAISSTSDVSLDGGDSGNKPADKGLKIKKAGRTITFEVVANKVVVLKVGSLKGGAQIKVNEGEYADLTGASPLSTGASVFSYYYSANVATYTIKTSADDYNIIQSITITNPYQVSYNPHGADAIAAQYGTPSVTLPTPVNGTGTFKGWYDAAEGGNKIGNAGASYTPTANITLHAQWETVSSDNTLSDLKVDGVTVAGFDPDVHIYDLGAYEYGQHPEITSATPTAEAAGATVAISNTPVHYVDATNDFWYVQANVTPVSGTPIGYNQVRYTVKPKQGVSLIKVVIPNGTGNDQNVAEANITGYIGGTAVQKLESGKHKLGSQGHYIGITLADGTFQENDIVNVNIETVTGDKLRVFSENTAAESKVVAQSTVNMVAGVNTVLLDATSTNSLYLRRGTDTENYQKGWNPFVGYFEVQRLMPSFIESFELAGVAGIIDQDLKTISVEVPYSTDITSLTPTIKAWANGGATLDKTGAQDFSSAVVYKVTSAYAEDGEVAYTVNVTKAEASHVATLSDIKLDGVSLVGFDPATLSYNVELEKGTLAYPTVTYTAATGATVVPSSEAFPGAYNLVVTAEDGTTKQTYTINFTVSTKNTVVIFDGTAATQAEALKASPDATGATWSLVGLSVSESAFTGYNYKIATGGQTGTSKHIVVTVPANYLPQFVITHVTNSNGSARNALVGTSTTRPASTEAALFYVTSSDISNPSTGTSAQLNEETTYYIHSDQSINFLKIALLLEPLAPKAATPTLSGLADLAACTLGTDELTVTASDLDGGTAHYQWYKVVEGDDPDEAVGTDANTYAPAVVGNYYVVVTNQKDGCRDNSKKSDEVTVSVKAATEITGYINANGPEGATGKQISVTATGAGTLHYVWYTCDDELGTNPVAVDPANDAATLSGLTIPSGIQYYKVVVTGECGSAEQILFAREWADVELEDVTNSVVWNWHKTQNPAAWTGITDNVDIAATSVLANVNYGQIPNVADFHSAMLKAVVGTVQTRMRPSTDNGCYQGDGIMFHTTVPGIVHVTYRGTGNDAKVILTVAGTTFDEYSGGFTRSAGVEVAAGDVTISSNAAMRIQKIEFYALAHERTSGYNAGDLGTVCLEDSTFIEGANLYELAGLDEHGYLAFDEITTGELEAGKPYLFEVTNPSKISFYKPVGAAHSNDEIAHKGMIGTFSGTTLYQNVTENYYYFSGRHIWKVNDFTVAIPIPGHRCYIDYDVLKNAQASPNPAPGRRRVTLGVQGTQVTTDINNVGSDDVQCTKVMIDGQLYILRGEKMYDATGRLVK